MGYEAMYLWSMLSRARTGTQASVSLDHHATAFQADLGSPPGASLDFTIQNLQLATEPIRFTAGFAPCGLLTVDGYFALWLLYVVQPGRLRDSCMPSEAWLPWLQSSAGCALRLSCCISF